MAESEELSVLIGQIYDAVLAPLTWTTAMERLCAFLGAKSTSVFVHDIAQPQASMFYEFGNDPYYIKLYNDEFIRLNPLVPYTTFYDVGEVFSLHDMVPPHEYLETRFYKEFSAPQGIMDGLFCNLQKSGTAYGMLAAPRGASHGPVDAEMRRKMRLITPHLIRAVSISRLMDVHRARSATFCEVLGKLDASVFMVDASGRIVFENTPGRELLANGGVLRNCMGFLRATDPEADKTLRASLAGSGRGGRHASAPGFVTALCSGTGSRWLAHVLPLTSNLRERAGLASAARAAVFVSKAELDVRPVLETLAKLYRLTAGEVRVLQALIEVGGAPAVAIALGVSETTVKTHLQSLFAKTGAKRQADLVKLAAAHASPLAG